MKEENNTIGIGYDTTVFDIHVRCKCGTGHNISLDSIPAFKERIRLAEESLVGRIRDTIINSKKAPLEDTMNEDNYDEGYEQCLGEILDLPILAPKPKGDE